MSAKTLDIMKKLINIELLPKDNLILIKGGVPGFRNRLLEIRSV